MKVKDNRARTDPELRRPSDVLYLPLIGQTVESAQFCQHRFRTAFQQRAEVDRVAPHEPVGLAIPRLLLRPEMVEELDILKETLEQTLPAPSPAHSKIFQKGRCYLVDLSLQLKVQ